MFKTLEEANEWKVQKEKEDNERGVSPLLLYK